MWCFIIELKSLAKKFPVSIYQFIIVKLSSTDTGIPVQDAGYLFYIIFDAPSHIIPDIQVFQIL
jgi:hypothetical protein